MATPKTTSVWPVNSSNEIVAQAGTGGTTIVGFLPSQFVLTDPVTNAVVFAGIGGSGGASAADIPFSLAVPLSSGGTSYMPQQNVTGAMTFTAMSNAVRNSLVYLRLVANGTNTPTFTGFKEWGSSLGYDNRNGIVNQIQFFYDGYDAFWSGSVAVGATAIDTTAPTVNSAAVANSTPTVINITFNEALATGYVPAASAFTVTGHTVSSVAISGSNINLTVTAAFVNGEAARTVDYVQPGVNGARDAAGNLVASFSARAITNNVAAVDTTAPVLQTLSMNGTSLTATYNEALNTTAPTLSSFALVVDGAAAVAPTASNISGTNVLLTFATAVTSAQVLSLSYTVGASPIRDTANNNATAFSAQSVTNSTSAGGLRLINTRNATETLNGSAYEYTGTGVAFSNSNSNDGAGVLNVAFQSGVNGSFQLKSTVTPVASTGPEILMGIDNSITVGTYAVIDYAMVNHPTGYTVFTNGTAGTVDNTVVGAANDVMRITRTGTSLVFDVSKDNGSTWTIVKTFTGVSTGLMYMHIHFAYASNAVSLSATGLS